MRWAHRVGGVWRIIVLKIHIFKNTSLPGVGVIRCSVFLLQSTAYQTAQFLRQISQKLSPLVVQYLLIAILTCDRKSV